MLISKRSVGLGKRGSVFTNKRILSTTNSDPSEWVLRNSKVTFTFLSDCLTGVKLDSFKINSSSKTWNTNTRCLWVLNTIKDVVINPHNLSTIEHISSSIFPTIGTFEPPSVVPVVNLGTKSFRFTWSGIKYNKNDQTKTCSVSVTASLGPSDSHLSFNTNISAEHNITAPTSTDVCISTVCYPKFVFKSESEAEDKNKIFAVPLGIGHSYKWPNKYMRTPRFDFESFHISNIYSRAYFGGQAAGLNPKFSTLRANNGSPGNMSLPCVVWGDTEDKEGILIYGHDPDGCHAKAWQWYSDDKNVILKTYDVSDHEIEPYGVGGKASDLTEADGYFGNRKNTIGWTLRIRPFTSPSRWVGWYGYSLYKQEAVPDLETKWMSKSFYKQAQEGEMDSRDLEVPIIIATIGPLSGENTKSGQMAATTYFKNLYKNNTRPVKTVDPTLHLFSWYPENNNLNWESYAQRPLINPSPFDLRAPDTYPVNDLYSGLFRQAAQSGLIIYPYLLFSYVIFSTSQYATTYSGYDLVNKSLKYADRIFQSGDQNAWIASSFNSSLFDNQFTACFSVPENYQQFLRIGADLGAHGAGLYHDTFGGWGRGCYANTHVYRSGTTDLEHTHPRGSFTHYFNKKQMDWVGGFSNQLTANSPTFLNRTGSKKVSIAQCAEGHTDSNIPYVPASIYYESQTAMSNIYFALNSNFGDTRTDILLSPVGGFVYPVYIEHPIWLERCPGYSIVYGDRTFLAEWASPHITNGMDYSGGIFEHGAFSGLDPTTNVSIHYTNTHEHRQTDMRCWLATDFPQLRRLTVIHGVLDYLHLTHVSGFLNVNNPTEDYSQVLETPQWSGYLNYCKQFLRLMSYEPDYLYHGDLSHPLDSWNVSVVNDHIVPRYAKASRTPNLYNITGGQRGDDAVFHYTIKKRNSSNMLISLINWHSGSHIFTGTFNPITYDINSSYQVYYLDVTSPEHGTKTLIDLVPARTSFDFTASIPSAELYNFEIVPISSLAQLEYFSDLVTSYTNIRYSYYKTELKTNNVGICYSYGSVVYEAPTEKNLGFLAPATQQITNNLPQWTAIRQNINSVGWQLVNSWGQNLEQVLQNTIDNISDIWLLTANPRHRNSIYKSDINVKEVLQDKAFTNLLFNSAFTIKDIARLELPAGWYDYNKSNSINSAKLDSFSFISSNSIALDGEISVSQILEVNGETIHDLVASVYISCNAETTLVKLLVVIENYDGTITSHQGTISSRSEEWRRLVVPIIGINKQVSRIKFIINSTSNDTAYISAPQLEKGINVSNWNRSNLDQHPLLVTPNRFSLVQAINQKDNTKISVYGLLNERDFLSIQIPTRIEKANVPYKDLEGYGNHFIGRKVDFFNQVYDTNWHVSNNYIIESCASESTFDTFNKYSIRDLRFYTPNFYGTRNENITRTLITSALRENLLYVVAKEIDTNNKITYALKIVLPRPPASQSEYLESLIDFTLDIDLSTVYGVNQLPETITSIGFSDKDPNYLIVNTSMSRRLFYRLYFDYYYLDNNSNQLYTLENYTESKIRIT